MIEKLPSDPLVVDATAVVSPPVKSCTSLPEIASPAAAPEAVVAPLATIPLRVTLMKIRRGMICGGRASPRPA